MTLRIKISNFCGDNAFRFFLKNENKFKNTKRQTDCSNKTNAHHLFDEG